MKSLQSVHGCVVGLACVSALTFASLGCSAGGGTDSESSGGGNTQSNGTSTSNGGSGGGFTVGTGGSMAAGMGGGCAGVSKTADKVPLDMYIMLDQSGSMSDNNKWGNVTNAIKTFIAAPEAAGIGVGIQYFPLAASMQNMCPVIPQQCSTDPQCGMCGPCNIMPPLPFGFCQGSINGNDSCTVSDYATPDVAIAALPGNGTALTNSLNAHGPTGGTPTLPALDGAIQHAKAHATANPDHAVIVVLASDGEPNSCNSDDLAAINAVAAAGANGNPKILTFVIGVGNIMALNGIAQAGGSGMAYIVDQANAQQQFLMALNDIQGKTLPCSYGIPDPPMGEMLNLAQVNVTYTPSGGTETLIPKVDGPAACPPGEDAWYFDNNTAPQLVVLCPDTCAKLKADPGTTVDVVFGCDTVVK